jgi:hypothetical protein
MTHRLTTAQVAAGFALIGRRPTSGILSTLPPVDAAAPGLLDGTGLATSDGVLTAEATTLFEVLADPGRIITSTVVTPVVDGTATSTFHAPAAGGPFVAIAATPAGYDLATVGTSSEAAAIVAGYLAVAGQPAPLEGGAAELTLGAWSVLATLADIDTDTPSLREVRAALLRRGPVAEAMHLVGPAGVIDPGSDGLHDAVNRLDAAGLSVGFGDQGLRLTAQGRAVRRALRQLTVAGSVTVDHVTSAGPVRVASLSSIRTPERLFFGAWTAAARGPVIALGEPGADAAATIVRTIVEAPRVLPAAVLRQATSTAPPPLTPPTRIDPGWLRNLIAAGLAIALIGAVLGLVGGSDEVDLGAATTTTIVTTDTTDLRPEPTQEPDDGGPSLIGIIALLAAVGLGAKAVMAARSE